MLISQNPYSLDLNLNDVSSPIVEFLNVKEYKLSQDGIKLEASADKAQRFKDRDVLYDINILVMQNGSAQTLKSDNATLINNIVYLNGNVRYSGNNTVVTTESVEYHQNRSMLVGKSPFRAERDNIVAYGSSFSYHIKPGKLNARDIKAVIQTER
jgi:lipopolysaccharide assembly outer membrane protein LptD (OstA)